MKKVKKERINRDRKQHQLPASQTKKKPKWKNIEKHHPEHPLVSDCMLWHHGTFPAISGNKYSAG
jgi:hypothetical protein